MSEPAVIIRDVIEMQGVADSLRRQGRRISVVPTMGFLHRGHLSLIEAAKACSDSAITTIFVNPLQFGPSEDFARYPRDLERDASLASGAGTDYLFVPDTQAMYTPDHHTFVDVERITNVLEGRSRPGHFRGVATVVAKLFNITRPHVAVFGQKDAQQVAVVRQMLRDLNFGIELVVCPTVRETDGLAMSSRNSYLSSEQRLQALVLYKSLVLAQNLIVRGERNAATIIRGMKEMLATAPLAVIDYVSIADQETLEELSQCRGKMIISLAVRFGATRLIDNTTLIV